MRKIIQNEILYSNYTAIADDKGNRRTYKELAEKAAEVGKSLETRSFIFILCDHHIETVEIIYEILFLNIVPLLLPADLDRKLLDQLVKIYQPQYIYCADGQGMEKENIVVMRFEKHTLWKTNAEGCIIHSDLALLLSTSGTTGSAKLVKISYDNLYDNAAYGGIHLKIQRGQKALSPLPLSYAYGISFCIWNWHWGATILTTEESVLSREFRNFFVREKVNNFAATPYTYGILQKLRFWNDETLEQLNFAISSGAQLSENEHKSLVLDMKDKFWIGYGQTECIGIVLGTNFQEKNIRIGTVGRAFDNVEVIADPETKEMVIKSKCVCMGYANNKAELAEGDVNQNILHTGDVIHIDENGYIYLKGRLKRYVKILGKRIGLDELSNYLEEQYPDVEFACVGTDDSINIYYTGTDKKAEDINNENKSIENRDREIQGLLERSMKIPSGFVHCFVLDKLPRSGSGKIAYTKLRELGEKNERKSFENM